MSTKVGGAIPTVVRVGEYFNLYQVSMLNDDSTHPLYEELNSPIPKDRRFNHVSIRTTHSDVNYFLGERKA